MDCSPPGSPVHEISQARILEWVVVSFSQGSPQPRNLTQVSCVSCTGRQTLYHCTTWESHIHIYTCGSNSQESACNAGDSGVIPGLGRSQGEGNGYPLQYSCLENSMDRGAWRATVHGWQRIRQDWATNTFTFILHTLFSLFPAPCPICLHHSRSIVRLHVELILW